MLLRVATGEGYLEIPSTDIVPFKKALEKLMVASELAGEPKLTPREFDTINRLMTFDLSEKPEPVAIAVWCVKDVEERVIAKRCKSICSKRKMVEILGEIDGGQDSEMGISYTSIDCALDELKERRNG